MQQPGHFHQTRRITAAIRRTHLEENRDTNDDESFAERLPYSGLDAGSRKLNSSLCPKAMTKSVHSLITCRAHCRKRAQKPQSQARDRGGIFSGTFGHKGANTKPIWYAEKKLTKADPIP